MHARARVWCILCGYADLWLAYFHSIHVRELVFTFTASSFERMCAHLCGNLSADEIMLYIYKLPGTYNDKLSSYKFLHNLCKHNAKKCAPLIIAYAKRNQHSLLFDGSQRNLISVAPWLINELIFHTLATVGGWRFCHEMPSSTGVSNGCRVHARCFWWTNGCDCPVLYACWRRKNAMRSGFMMVGRTTSMESGWWLGMRLTFFISCKM